MFFCKIKQQVSCGRQLQEMLNTWSSCFEIFFKKFERQYATKIQTLTNAVDTKILARVQSAGNQSHVLVLAYQHDVDQGISSTFLQVLDRVATIMALGNLPTTIWNFLLSTATAIQNVQPTVEAKIASTVV